MGGTATDAYIVIWLGVALLLGALGWWKYPGLSPALRWLLFVAAGLRVVDITQVVVNVGIFDQLGFAGRGGRQQAVEDVTRSLVLLVWNYCELMVWFGLAYIPLDILRQSTFQQSTLWSRFYFSAVTQLTIGYGDLAPVGWAKAIAAAQGTLGWMLTVIIVARFVASLPPIRGLERRS